MLQNSSYCPKSKIKFLFPVVVFMQAQACLTFCDHMDCSLPGSSVHANLQARILEYISSRGSSRPLWPLSLALAGRFFTTSATWEPLQLLRLPQILPSGCSIWKSVNILFEFYLGLHIEETNVVIIGHSYSAILLLQTDTHPVSACFCLLPLYSNS